MHEDHYDQFSSMLSAIGDMKRQPQSQWAITVWWKALAAYDFVAVEDALIRHVQNPDNGMFMPAPADIIKLIDGNTLDAALLAWAKVDRAVRTVGPHFDVVFDDAIIHRVVEDMGGWAGFGLKTDDEWPFIGKEFQNRYRGCKTRADHRVYPLLLAGNISTHNGALGSAGQAPHLIGDARKAAAVMRGGSSAPAIGMALAGEQLLRSLPALPAASNAPQLAC